MRFFFIQKGDAKMTNLTPKQKRFCDEYLISLNATQAAIKAGYSRKTAGSIGDENLKKPEIKKYIETRLKEKEKELIADQNEVLEYLTLVMRGKSQSEEIIIEGCGKGISEARLINKHPDEKDRIKAAELLGKAHGAFSDKIDLNGDMELNIVVDYGDDDN